MAVLTASAVPAPSYLPADYRYGTDDWQGSNALTYIVWQMAPVPAVYGLDGVTVVTPAVVGVPLDLTECTVSGTIRYRQAPFLTRFLTDPPPFMPVGSIVGDPKAGEIALSLPKAVVGTILTQDMRDWGDLCEPCLHPELSRLIARPAIIDPSGVWVSVGDQPLFVF